VVLASDAFTIGIPSWLNVATKTIAPLHLTHKPTLASTQTLTASVQSCVSVFRRATARSATSMANGDQTLSKSKTRT
jgi:hypothetical protein